ncbi:MAG: pectate lyase [Bacteroides sp.]|nr:pectate lyase [Bacteroides sp.]
MKTLLLKTVRLWVLIAILGVGCSNDGDTEIIIKKGEGPFPDYGEVLAFPGAEGYGRFATGGRGGEIYRVTNLNDSGEGSLRDAVSKPDRIVIFDVAGVIHLESVLTFADNITIAAQTAPGDGIVLYGDRVSFSDTKNLICRYLRVRMGKNGPSGKDAAGIAAGSNMIFDHMSITWGRDENFSINGSNAYDITIQNTIMGQGLQTHSCGGLMQTNENNGITLYRNLYIDNKTRNPKVKGLNQYVNNVVYNWGNGGCYIMGDTQATSIAHIENNYFITGACIDHDGTTFSPTAVFTRYNANFQAYLAGNYFDGNKDGTLNGRLMTNDDCTSTKTGEDGVTTTVSPTFLAAPSSKHPAISNMMSAEDAYKWVVKNVGASLPARDQVDMYLIDELTSLGTKGNLISDEAVLGLEGNVGIFATGQKPLDSDNDGMPDEFEEKYGLDKYDASDATLIATNGYTNIENYIFTLDAQLEE